MLLYASTVFLSAFLLFQIQPIISKLIQPWFGGTAAVWATCLVFFQAALLLGYLYAHWVAKYVNPGWQGILHASLLSLSLLLLPVLPSGTWRPDGVEEPVWRILGLLAVTVGAPYLMLSATAPLLQCWYARTPKHGLVYGLYAVANAAAVIGLIAYPFAVEPFLATEVQAKIWSAVYVAFAFLAIGVSLGSVKNSPAVDEDSGGNPEIAFKTRLLWLLLAGLPSMLLVAITNYLTHSIASVPFLWILPLAVYLASFIICFGAERWASRLVFMRLLAIALMTMAYFHWQPKLGDNIRLTVVLFSAGLFVCSMFCHGELIRRKPHPRHLTSFYLVIALGGATGGVLISIVAPLVLPGFFELPIGLAGLSVLALGMTFRESWRTDVLWITVSVFLIATVIVHTGSFLRGSLVSARNFYGTVRVSDFPGVQEGETVRGIIHGTTDHGRQFLSPQRRRQPTSYYGADSGIGLVMRRMKRKPVRAGVIGLGAGCLAVYGDEGDYFRFYEINPIVVRFSREYFHYLEDSRARIDIVVGDGRSSLERESPQRFDILVVDAFSGGSIPVHMLVREAFEQYFRHLQPEGVLALHISNKWLDLAPVVAEVAWWFNARGVLVNQPGAAIDETSQSTWALLTRQGGALDEACLMKAAKPLARRPGLRMWTDDYSNLYQIMK
jgi:hypothetical protein